MSPLRRLAFLLVLCWSSPSLAAFDADLILIYGSSWKRVLPAYAAAARAPEKRSAAVAKLPPVVLWTEGEERWTEELLQRLAPKKIVLIGPPGSSASSLRLPGTVVQRIEATDERIGQAIADAAFHEADRPSSVWVAEGGDVAGAIVAAANAAARRSPLLVASGDLSSTVRQAATLADRLGAKEIVVVGGGDAGRFAQIAGKVRILGVEEALRSYNDLVPASRHLVVTSPSDAVGPFTPPKLSLGSLPFLLERGAALALVGRGEGHHPDPEVAAQGLESRGAGPFDFVTLVGDPLAIPMQQVRDLDQVARGSANPRVHKVPSFVDEQGAPSDRAVGRLATLDVFDLSRWVARLLHPVEKGGDGDGVLVLANADEKFILGETISRTTSAELENAGVKVHSYYREAITPELIQRRLGGHALILWEGHPRDLTLDDDALPAPESPLPPATYFLQGCYTLDRSDPFILVERGANAVLGTYMAVYSASGSGFARAYLNAQLHQGATAGEALSSARNYLLAVVELKKRRGHKDWRKTLRAALSFDLWGDPTARLPFDRKAPKRPAVSARLAGNRLTVRIPKGRLPTAAAGPYEAAIRPGAALSGLYNFEEDGKRRLSELFFVETRLPEGFGDDPKVSAPIPDDAFAWIYAPRSRVLSLLIHESALPSRDAPGTLLFTVDPSPRRDSGAGSGGG